MDTCNARLPQVRQLSTYLTAQPREIMIMIGYWIEDEVNVFQRPFVNYIPFKNEYE